MNIVIKCGDKMNLEPLKQHPKVKNVDVQQVTHITTTIRCTPEEEDSVRNQIYDIEGDLIDLNESSISFDFRVIVEHE